MAGMQNGNRDNAAPMTPRACWVVFISFFLLAVVSAITWNKPAPVLTIIGDDFAMDLSMLGWINSCFSVMGMIIAFPSALLIRKLGFRLCFIVIGLSIVIGGLLGMLTTSAPVFLASRVIEGLGLGLVAVVCPAAIVRLFEPSRRGLPMGVWATWMGVAGVFTFALAPIITEAFGWRSLWLFTVVLGAAATVFTLAVLRFPQQQEEGEAAVAAAHVGPRADLRSIILVSIAFLAWNFMMGGGFSSFYPTYLQDAGSFDPATAALIATVPNVIAMLTSPISGPLVAKRLLYKPLIVVDYALAILFFGILCFMEPPSPLSIGIAMVGIGITAGIAPVMVFSLVPIFARTPQQADFGMAVLAVFQNAGLMMGPAAFSATVAATSWSGAAMWLHIPIMVISIACLLFTTNPRKYLESES